MLPKMRLYCAPSSKTAHGYSTTFHLDGTPDPVAQVEVVISSAKNALAQYEEYKARCQNTGVGLAVAGYLVQGKAPRGFRQLNLRSYVNLD